MCNCIQEVNQRLEEEQPDNNTEIQVAFSPMGFASERVIVATRKRGIYNTTKKEVNKALAKLGNLQIQKGNGYLYFSGEIASTWKEQGIYGASSKLSEWTVEKIIAIAQQRIEKNK